MIEDKLMIEIKYNTTNDELLFYEVVLPYHECYPKVFLNEIIYDKHAYEEYDSDICLNQSTVEILNKRREVEGVDILEKIISIQPKIKLKTPHSSYFTNLMIYAKK